jgi:hypothetical protein
MTDTRTHTWDEIREEMGNLYDYPIAAQYQSEPYFAGQSEERRRGDIPHRRSLCPHYRAHRHRVHSW